MAIASASQAAAAIMIRWKRTPIANSAENTAGVEKTMQDRLSTYRQWSLPLDEAIAKEFAAHANPSEAEAGASRFVGGAGRHGSFSDD